MESTKTGIKKPLNKIHFRKVLFEMEIDYEKIKINIANYEKDYDNTINNLSTDVTEKIHANNSQKHKRIVNFNKEFFCFLFKIKKLKTKFFIFRKYILDNVTKIMSHVKTRIDKIKIFALERNLRI